MQDGRQKASAAGGTAVVEGRGETYCYDKSGFASVQFGRCFCSRPGMKKLFRGFFQEITKKTCGMGLLVD